MEPSTTKTPNRIIVVLLATLVLGAWALLAPQITEKPVQAQTSRNIAQNSALPNVSATKDTFKKLGGNWVNLNYIVTVRWIEDDAYIYTTVATVDRTIRVHDRAEVAWLERYLKANEAR